MRNALYASLFILSTVVVNIGHSLMIRELKGELARAHERLSILEEVQGFSNAEGKPTKPNLWWTK